MLVIMEVASTIRYNDLHIPVLRENWGILWAV